MQSRPIVPTRTSLPLVPRMMLVPGGQQDGSSPRIAVTTWVTVTLLPAASVAVQVTIVVPRGNTAGALLVTVTGPAVSLAVTTPRFGVRHCEIVTGKGGLVNTGGVESTTFTVNAPDAVAPAMSVTV